VLGTKFNVSQRRGTTRVVLSEGKVKLVARDGGRVQPLLMQPGDYAELSPARSAFRKKAVKPENYSSWRDNKLIFEQTPLPEVLQAVEDFYGVRIVLADTTLADRKFTSTLPNNDLDVVLKSLERVFGFEVVRGPDQILLQ
jgi:ferric-dicitrate binding protein FerR (iron transport regulator)